MRLQNWAIHIVSAISVVITTILFFTYYEDIGHQYTNAILVFTALTLFTILLTILMIIHNRQRRAMLFHHFFYDGPIAKLLIDPETFQIIDANDAASKFYGWPLDQLRKMKITKINSDIHLKENIKLAINREQTTFIYRHKLSNGEERHVEVFSGPVMMNGKKIVFSIIHDITDRIKAEQSLFEREELFRLTFRTIPDAAIITRHSDGTIIDVNEGFTKMTQYERAEAVGKTTLELNLWKNQQDRRILSKGVEESGFYENYEQTFCRKDGSLLTGLVSVKLFQLNGIPHIISITRNISERKLMEDELLRSKEKAEESNRLKTSFLHNISHEIRTPMNGIIGFANLLKYPGLPEAEKESYLDIINNSANQLMKVLDEVLEVSSIESGTVYPEESNFDLTELMETIYHDFKNQVSTDFFYSPGLNKTFILGDKDKIIRVLTSLIHNAIKFTPKGSVSFGYTINNATIQFFVKDTGIGIPQEEQTHIFEKFYSIDNDLTKKHGGNGLGLNIAKNLVEMMGGKIWLNSKPGIGTEFYFTIPNNQSETVIEDDIQNISFSGKTILIAEDEHSNFQFFRIILSIKGANIEWAKDGSEAVEMVLAKKPDLVLMDLKMPVMDGLESTRRIKALYPDLPIIAQTAYSLPKEKEQALASGCSAFITKPIKANDLFNIIHKELEVRG